MLELGPDNIRLGSTARDKDEAITLVGRAMVESGFISPAYIDAMRGREQLASTFLGNGIAIPHGLPEAREQVLRTGIVVVQFPAGVPWGDSGLAHLAVGIAARSDEHIQVLANLTGVLGDAATAARLAVTTDREEIAAHLNGKRAAVATPETVAVRGASITVVAPSPHGLHARPATELVETAKRFTSNIAVRRGDKSANAKSLISLLGLGASGGTELTVLAEGPDAGAALSAIAAAFARGLGEGQPEAPAAEAAPAPVRPALAYGGRMLAGVSASPGIATAPVWHFQRERLVVHPTAPDPLVQRDRLDKALASATAELHNLYEEFWKKAGAAKAAIFKAHLELLEDPELVAEAHRRIERGASAGWAWRETYEERATLLGGIKDALLAARAGDLRDVGRRVLRLLADEIQGSETSAPDHPVIILAEDLSPSDTAKLDPRTVLGLCTAGGGATSHTAIIARSLDLPAVVAAGPAVIDLTDGQECIIDGDNGVIIAEPTPADRALAAERQRQSLLRREEERRACYLPAVTTDGVRVEVAANISSPKEAAAAVNGGAEGVGLMRTEFLFLQRDTPPSEEEQLEVYEAILRAMNGLPVILRTLDIGGDKEVPYLSMPAEENPFLGVRGLRLCLQRPDLFRTQLRAIFRASRLGAVRLMFPMVTTPSELTQAKAIAEEVRRDVGAKPVEVGIMIEVPAAVVMADQFAREVDFFSIGTNDLTQYVLAMDRLHPVLAPQADGLHPAVLRMVRQTVEAAKRNGIWVGACGGIAGDPAGAMMLAGLGVAELSVGIPSIAAIKARMRGLSMARLEEMARRALDCQSAAEVRALAVAG
ncbi:phosphoenolpyruvate--protein phosphotransferase [Hyalangium rubrum]|uniref:Multiphosphoryl transfer protein n=1 Tax=Hyalangium rubrum TaxID=3103134 RepID=A0ABU5H1L5_9BACT|nr:phosphoenolpyruvate--protein phosphotransferase [Hyalangium sp. s54d21]MDY7226648.1 phosphoenolpyruvate--protein phosphotransferase [Hyalangium sp. s54d21]